jgi:ATP-binding cassette, subfamily B (MDR/TAP), member 1
VLQNGRAVEQGTHQSLLEDAFGIYSALVRAQELRLSDGESEAAEAAQDIKVEPRPDTAAGSEVALAAASQEQPAGQGQGQRRSFANSFLRLLYEQQARWPTYASIVAGAMAVGACTPLQAWLFAQLINIFLLDPSDDEGRSELGSRSSFWCLMWFCLAAGYGLSWFTVAALAFRAQYRVSAAYKLQYLADMVRQPLAFFDRPGNAHGSLTARIAGDAKMLEELLGMNLACSLTGVFIVLGCVAISISFGWKLGLVATFVTMPVMVGSGLWKYRHDVQFDQMNAAVFAESSQFATEAIEAIRTVSSLTMEDTIGERYRKLLNGHVSAALQKAKWTSALYGFADSVGLGCQALVFWYGGRLMASGEYSLEAFFVCFMAVVQGAESASQVLSVVPNAAQASGAANRILDIQESAAAHQARNEANMDKNNSIPDGENGMAIELRDVSFSYPTRNIPVLKKLNVQIPRGHFAAFVGPSGCGKTTIISLLERFYDLETDHGAILCDGVDVSALDVDAYRQRLSLVAQESILFRGTIRENILFGVADPSEEAIHQACRDAFIHEFIVSLPEGYDTDVGHRGVSMSGGQKQRIALARALIRNPGVLLLDEATSALDSESEKYVQAALEAARGRRTVIAVAHRLSTVQNADIIFFVEAGTVVEKGSHDELIRRRGAYWSMVSTPFTLSLCGRLVMC